MYDCVGVIELRTKGFFFFFGGGAHHNPLNKANRSYIIVTITMLQL